jgi:mono/diheme cytochrome c family protein
MSIGAAAALAMVVGGRTQITAQAQPPPQVKTASAPPFVGVEGKDSYMAFCAVCHGIEGRGNGPAAPALKMPVPDLTTMAKRHGKFDRINVERRISGVDQMPVAHGTHDDADLGAGVQVDRRPAHDASAPAEPGEVPGGHAGQMSR